MTKKITLIFPGKREKSSMLGIAIRLPLAVLSMAAYMEKRGYEVSVVDTRIKDIRQHDFSKDLCVGISNSFSGINISHSFDAANYIRSKYPSIPLVWGGVHPSLHPKQTLNHDLVDFVVIGEGEETFYELAEALHKKESVKHIQGLAYKENGEINKNPDRPFLNPDDLPPLAYHLVDIKDYPNIKKYFDYQSSRGCPHRCGFCYNLKFCGSKWRAKSAEKVIQEITYLANKYAVEEFSFIDDNFFVDKERILKICEGMIKNEIKSTWIASCRLDYFSSYDLDFVKLLKKSGCQRILFGAESGSQRILDLIDKDITINQILKSIEMCKDAGITPVLSFIIGFPKEKKSDILLTLDIYDRIKKIYSKAEINIIGLYSPYPGTTLYDQAVEQGFKPPKTLEAWSKWQFSFDTNIPWLTGKQKEMVKTINYIARYKFGENEFIRRNKSFFVRTVFSIINFPYHVSANLRWKNRIFSAPIEWKIWIKLVKFFFQSL